jgi:hypothetical protein
MGQSKEDQGEKAQCQGDYVEGVHGHVGKVSEKRLKRRGSRREAKKRVLLMKTFFCKSPQRLLSIYTYCGLHRFSRPESHTQSA